MEAAASTSSTGTDTITVGCAACAFTIYSITGFVAFGQSSATTLGSFGTSTSDSRTMSVQAGSLILGDNVDFSATVSCGTFTLTTGQVTQQTFPCQTVSGQGSASGISTSQFASSAGTFTDSMTFACPGCNSNQVGIGRFIEEIQGTGGGGFITQTQCFGNCGNPAITTVNTNSTHSVNFNQSLTLLYVFQASLTGYFTNVTTTVAQASITSLQSPILAIYIANCPPGQTAFSAACPGSNILTGNTGVLKKGRASITAGPNFLVNAGQWVAIAVTAQFAPLDINDTNTQVPMQQVSGTAPSILSGPAVFSAVSKVGLWTFIVGSPATAPPPTTGAACNNNFAQIDCFLPALVNDFCSTLTSQCQTTSALLWVVILSIGLVAFAVGMFHTIFPTVSFNFGQMGEMFMLILLVVVLMMTNQGLLPPYVPILIFFVTAILVGKRVEGYF